MALNIKDSLQDLYKDHKKLWLALGGLLVLLIAMYFVGKGSGTGGGDIFNLGIGVTGDDVGGILDTGNVGSNGGAPALTLKTGVDYKALIKTNYGDITVDLYETDTPVTVNNFVYLSKSSFYNNLSFHRVVKGFVIQGGDPVGNGTGGPGYTFEDEIDADALGLNTFLVKDATFLRGLYNPAVPATSVYSSENLSAKANISLKDFYTQELGYKYTTGKGTNRFGPYVLAMANSGPNTNGSQFFITVGTFDTASASSLNGKHTVFGKVTDGFFVVDAIEAVNTNSYSVPTSPVEIQSIQILEQ